MWKLYCLDGHDKRGRRIWRDMGIDSPTREAGAVEVAIWRDLWPHHTYQVRKARR